MPLPVLAALLALMAGAGVMIAGRLPDVAVPFRAAAAVAALTAGMTLALGQPTAAGPALWSAALVLPLAALATVDAATRTLPDALTFAWAALALAHLWWTGAPLTAPLAGAAALVALGLLVDRLAPDAAVGAGDLLLLAGVILWLGFAPMLELAISGGTDPLGATRGPLCAGAPAWGGSPAGPAARPRTGPFDAGAVAGRSAPSIGPFP